MYTKILVTAAMILVVAGGALIFAGGVSSQSREVEPALLAGEQVININASAFIPQDPNKGANWTVLSTSSTKSYLAALQLPQGSTIKRIGFWAKDNDNGAYMLLQLFSQVNSTGTNTLIRDKVTSTTGYSDTFQYWYSPRFNHTMKWNRSYFLVLSVAAKSASPPNNQQFLYARVIYVPMP